MNDLLICCPVCRSHRLQFQVWVRINSREMLDDTERYCWCDACDEDGNSGEIEYGECLELPANETREGTSPLSPALSGTVELFDQADEELGSSPPVLATVEVGPSGIKIAFDGYGSADGSADIVAIEMLDGTPRVLIWPDASRDEAEVIELAAALHQ
jgi:hypothetical protein